jgi:hypothetical protein
MADEPRRAFLGLRSNVHFFASRRGFTNLDSRLKALALVYDRLVFEMGVYHITIGEGGSFGVVSPYSGNPSELEPIRTQHGTPFSVRAALTGSDDYETVIATSTVKSYRAQFITTLQELMRLKTEWSDIADYTIVGPGMIAAQDADRIANGWIWDDSQLLKDFEPNLPRYLRDALIKHLYTDVARATLLKSDVAPDDFHSKLLKRKVSQGAEAWSAGGARTLRLLLPDIRYAKWEDITELRKDRGLNNLRAKLREFDAISLSDTNLIRRVSEEYASDVEEYRPRWHQAGATLFWNLLNYVPFANIAGPMVQAKASIQKAAAAQSHWTASLMRIRRRVEQARADEGAPEGTQQ